MQFKNWIIYLLLAVILVLIIILYWRTSSTISEPFTSDEKLAKHKTTDYNKFQLWSNKITALKSNNLVSPLSFWSPNLKTSKNLGYLKLGDTISTDNNFTHPTSEIILVKGDTVAPSTYSKIAQITNPALDKLTPTERANYIHLMTNIKDFNNVNAISAAFSSILNVLPDMQDSIRSNMVQKVLDNIAVYRYASIWNGDQDFYLRNFYKYNDINHGQDEVMPNDYFIANYQFLTEILDLYKYQILIVLSSKLAKKMNTIIILS
jgi:hypothetical protein